MYEYKIKSVVKVVDGDTLYLKADLGFYIDYNVKLRLSGIDTPEIFGEKDPIQREKGVKCREFVTSILEEHIMGNNILMLQTTGKPDKYGRWLGDVYLIGGQYHEAGAESLSNLVKRFLRSLNS